MRCDLETSKRVIHGARGLKHLVAIMSVAAWTISLANRCLQHHEVLGAQCCLRRPAVTVAQSSSTPSEMVEFDQGLDHVLQ